MAEGEREYLQQQREDAQTRLDEVGQQGQHK